jgi:hypothetical protein
MATATESKQFTNIAATTAGFTLRGGNYVLTASGTITSVQLQVMSLDNTTWINVGTALAAAGLISYSLAPGTYRLNITGTAIYAALTSVPT